MLQKLMLCIFAALSLCSVNAYAIESETVTSEQTEEPINVKDFFRTAEKKRIRLNPVGDIYAYQKYNEIMVGSANVAAQSIYTIKETLGISSLQWISNRILMVKVFNRTTYAGSTSFLEISLKNGNFNVSQDSVFDKSGYVLDPLVDEGEWFLFAEYKKNDEGWIYTDVYKVSAFDEKSKYLRSKQRINLNSNSGEIYTWLSDKNGSLVAGVSFVDDVPSVWFNTDGGKRLSKIWTANEKIKFFPYGMSESRDKLWIVTDYKTDKLVARTFDLKSGEFGDILFQAKNVDLDFIMMDRSDANPLAVAYMNKGKLEYAFIDEAAQKAYEKLQPHFEGKRYWVTSMSDDLKHQIIFSNTDTQASEYHLCDSAGKACHFIGYANPRLQNVTLSPTHSVKTTTHDGFEIESFLTMPARFNLDSVPLIVMPHGGPIGVNDDAHFDPDTQWLAYNGYAVLQVNYRGSSGYGKAFKLEGMQQWGRGIEDDIEASLENVIKSHPELDKNRVCLYGGSYGGYSAVMGIIRSPEKYRCAASFAGVMDLPLNFNKSSVQNDEDLTKRLKEIVGDPETQMQELMDNSPVYLFDKITRPLFLAHGTKDGRVDVEHSWRLRRLLQLADIPHEWLIMDDIGHGFEDVEEVEQLYDHLMPFLNKHLDMQAGQQKKETVQTAIEN
ncbi:S9 family peptidase [Paraneptunicella aestuarii]|uniref:alpha/beta hydrolase family protein n=1 Tax=Paraneptunicella aestuarii TaxID=2831148 RepID=UPI001E5EEC87|nr:prolyl oligopeptidase family serine peptidase [Paraneptunicella aestuarii]UAA38896.1 S9 family peptidase [Paraneptunicella aestuarii]